MLTRRCFLSTRQDFLRLGVGRSTLEDWRANNVSLARAENLIFRVIVAKRTLCKSPLQGGVGHLLTRLDCFGQLDVPVPKIVEV
jgi:hypothetical protein